MNLGAIHPIIYVRGYAMTHSEIQNTVADRYMGFNIGSSRAFGRGYLFMDLPNNRSDSAREFLEIS